MNKDLALHLIDSRKDFIYKFKDTPNKEILNQIKTQGLVPLYMHMVEVEKAYKTFQDIGLAYDYQLHSHFQSRGVDDRINLICKWIEKHSQQGIIYPDYNLAGTETGRVTSRGFPFANLDNNPDIRKIFKAREGCCYLYLDYSQAEIITAAYLFNSEKFFNLLRTNADIYYYFSNLWGIPDRDIAKQCLILSIYGGSTKAFSRVANCDEQTAFLAQSLLFHEFPEIRDWIGHTRYVGSQTPYVTNAFGRRRSTSELKPQALINFPIQSALADIKMVAIRNMYELGLIHYMRLDFHDGLVFELPIKEAATLKPKLIHIMENPNVKRYFPNVFEPKLKVSVKISRTLDFS